MSPYTPIQSRPVIYWSDVHLLCRAMEACDKFNGFHAATVLGQRYTELSSTTIIDDICQYRNDTLRAQSDHTTTSKRIHEYHTN